MNQELAQLNCSACRGDEPPLNEEKIRDYLEHVPAWDLVTEDGVHKLRRTFKFKDFAGALAFTNQVGEVAEGEGHHPIITLTWGRVTITWYSHRIDGLHENDFIMAAKTSGLYASTS